MYEFNPKVKEALQKINFVERYEALSNLYSKERIKEEERLLYIDVEEVIETIEDLGYHAKFLRGEGFYKLQEEKKDGYTFGFHICLKYGLAELIWVVKEGKKVLLGRPWGACVKEMHDGRIPMPVIGDYDDLEDILKTAFAMFEDFKSAFLAQ